MNQENNVEDFKLKLPSGAKISLGDIEYLRKIFGAEPISYPFYPSYPVYPSWPSWPFNWPTTTCSTNGTGN